MAKIETGVMVVKGNRTWGTTYKDGHSTSYGWVPLEEGIVRNPKYCKKPTDVTYEGSPYTTELKTAKLVHVRRTTTVELL